MNLHIQKKRIRRKTDFESRHSFEKAVDELAMNLCPEAEWQAYYNQKSQISWRLKKQGHRKPQADVVVYPVWKKYRQQAMRVVTLQQAAPFLRHLPLRISHFLGEVLFQ